MGWYGVCALGLRIYGVQGSGFGVSDLRVKNVRFQVWVFRLRLNVVCTGVPK